LSLFTGHNSKLKEKGIINTIIMYQAVRSELHNLYSYPDVIRQVKSRRMRWAGHVARTGEEKKVYKVLVGNPEGNRPLGRPRRGKMGSEWILGRLGWGVWMGFDCLKTGTGGGLL
jgi:hypothetical protein